MAVKIKPFYEITSNFRFYEMTSMFSIFCKEITKVYIAKVSKYTKKTNNSMYKLFRKFLRVLILQVRFSRPL